MAATGCADHDQPGHVCNHTPSSVSESLDELDFARSIHAACINNNVSRVQTILAKGNSRTGSSPATSLDSAGYTALVCSMQKSLDRGSQCGLYLVLTGSTLSVPKHYASRAGNKEICTLLLNGGADVDAKTPELGTTPLMRAVQQNHLAVARLLVSYGANMEESNSDKENIFHILAIAAKNDPSQNGNNESFLELARWLRIRAESQQDGRLDKMLTAQDIRGRTPFQCLGENADKTLSVVLQSSSPGSQHQRAEEG